ncbi:MAG TPA: prepilin-type N-terminal cleavage/methylation domain-containing protein, partial [Myxococcota bacterium]
MRGFTLIEVSIGLAISAVISTAAIATVVQTNRLAQEATAKAQLQRDSHLVLSMLGKDLQFLGSGVPRGFRYDNPDFAPAQDPAHQLRPPVRVGQSDNIAFVGDLPYPNADLNGVVQIAQVAGAGNDHVYLESELSPCVPQSGAGNYRCPNQNTSLVGSFAGVDQCKAGSVTRLCPWKMNKWQNGSNGVHFIVGTPDGSWYEREWPIANATVSDGGYFGININGGGAPNGSAWNGGASESLNQGPLPGFDPLFGKASGTFASTVDRVFWSWEKRGAPGTACGGSAPDCV